MQPRGASVRTQDPLLRRLVHYKGMELAALRTQYPALAAVVLFLALNALLLICATLAARPLRERLPEARWLRLAVVTIFLSLVVTLSSALFGYMLSNESLGRALRSSVEVGASFALVYAIYLRWQARQSG